MEDELIDIVDEHNGSLGIKKLMKSEAHKNGLWHRAAHIWIYNPKGEILLQLRAKDKALYPNMWDISSAGHVQSGEEPFEAGLREIQEELGLKLKKEDLQFFKIRREMSVYRKIKNNEFCYLYFLKYEGDAKKLKLQEEEVQQVKFLPASKIEKELMLNPKKYVPHGGYWSEVINEVRKRTKA